MNSKQVKWQTIGAIFADVLVSPWNLLVGGLLITRLTLLESIVSIIVGYFLLGLVFYFYGGLGLSYRKKTSEIIEPIFGKMLTKYGFSSLLAIGQIGWFAIITQIGGTSLAALFDISSWIGVIIYALLMYFISSLSLYKTGIVKLLITASSLSLIVYLVVQNFHGLNLQNIYSSAHGVSTIIWGVGIVFFSLISFASVSPDFTSQLESRRDLILTIFGGIILPGIVITILGAILFFGKELSFEVLIGVGTLSFMGYIFNIVTNTDASVAIYTPANRLEYMFGLKFKLSLLMAVILGTILALVGIKDNLELWLGFLGIFYPLLIFVVLGYYFRKRIIKT